jgi:hypothetical protein
MSEIIAAVYKAMEDSGVSEGILFLDEFNCVSETLAPVMLQFLQTKEFGGHRLPEGWIIVIAGNPVEYNESARALDMVTLDRLCHITVEADYAIWRDYAVSQSIFPAILSYLDIYPDDFSYLGGMAEIRSEGLSIPQDISVTGYDGINLSEVVEPNLTTWRQDTGEIGRRSAQKLIETIEEGKDVPAETISVSGKLFTGCSIMDHGSAR